MARNFFAKLARSAKKRARSLYRITLSSIGARYIASRDDFTPEVIVMVDGGLGSQLMKYAVGRGAGLASGLPVSYDLEWFSLDGKDINGIHDRKFELTSVFPDISFRKADRRLTEIYKWHFDSYPGVRFQYEEPILSSGEPRYLGGYYMSAQYADAQGDGLRDELRFACEDGLTGANLRVRSLIAGAEKSVAVHIRRGDYVNTGHDLTTPKYFRTSINCLSERLRPARPTFFVFSNGIEWAKGALRDMDEKIVFVEANGEGDGALDMFLMSCCQHFIISNSSFGWWPAWISRRAEDKMVLMPDRFLERKDKRDELPLYVDGWTVMPVD